MNHDLPPNGETGSESHNEFVDGMENVKPFDPKAAESAIREAEASIESEKLEEKRKKFIEAYTLSAIGGGEAVADTVNKVAATNRNISRESIIERTVVALGRKANGRILPDINNVPVTTDGEVEIERLNGRNLISPEAVEGAYKAGVSLFAGSEEGLSNAAKLKPNSIGAAKRVVGSHGGEVYLDISTIDAKERRMIQAGANAIKGAMADVIAKSAEHYLPELERHD